MTEIPTSFFVLDSAALEAKRKKIVAYSKEIDVGIGARIREVRLHSGIRQFQLSQILGLKSRISISHLEAGKRSLKAREVLAVAEACGVSCEWLLTGEYSGEPNV